MVQEAERVHDGHDQQGAPNPVQRLLIQQPAGDFDADHLVPMHRGTDEGDRPLAATMDHVNPERYRRVVGQHRDRQADRRPLPGGNGMVADPERRAPRHQVTTGLRRPFGAAGASADPLNGPINGPLNVQ